MHPGNDDTPIGPAELRVRRVTSSALGVAVFVYLVANLVEFQRHPDALRQWWSLTALTGRLVFGTALLAAPWFADGRAIRPIARAFAIFGVVIVAASVLAAATGASVTLRDRSLYALSAVLAFRPRLVWVWIIASEVLAIVAQALPSPTSLPLIESALVSFTTTALLVFLVLAVLRSARLTDAREQAVLRSARLDVAQAARASEQRRIALFVHDDVLSTLQAASLGISSPSADPASLARSTLERLAAFDAPLPSGPEARVSGDELLDRIRALVTEMAPDAGLRVAASGPVAIPADAARAIVEACAEALRNSVLHAPSDRIVTRSILAHLSPQRVQVTVTDDGDGFDVNHVMPERLGVARSIIERLKAVPGGDAAVTSTRSLGTSVTVSWRV